MFITATRKLRVKNCDAGLLRKEDRDSVVRKDILRTEKTWMEVYYIKKLDVRLLRKGEILL